MSFEFQDLTHWSTNRIDREIVQAYKDMSNFDARSVAWLKYLLDEKLRRMVQNVP